MLPIILKKSLKICSGQGAKAPFYPQIKTYIPRFFAFCKTICLTHTFKIIKSRKSPNNQAQLPFLRLPKAANPTSPVKNSSIVAGSGTGAGAIETCPPRTATPYPLW